MSKELYRDTHLEINLDIIKNNIKKIRAYIGKDIHIAAVLKANAYGHGTVAIAKAVIEAGCEMIAVATLTEGIELRKTQKKIPILIMGHTPTHLLHLILKYDLIQTVFTYSQAEHLSDLAHRLSPVKKVTIHIKYDTGFNRLGFKDCSDSILTIQKIIELPNLNVEGIFSHLALKDQASNNEQYQRFTNAIAQLESDQFKFQYKHIADSISGIDNPEFRMDMIRPGAIIYGLKSYKNDDISLEQALTFKTRISHLKWLQKGEGISYDYMWVAPQRSLIATLPFGYADGFPRVFKETPMVTIHGHKVPIIGVKCMDQCMADVTSISHLVHAGDEVIIYGDGSNNTFSIQDISQLAGTNKNEIVARLSRRVPRVYIENQAVSHIVDYLVD